MAILSRVKISPQQRFDLEDFFAGQSAQRTDSKLWTQSFLSPNNLVLSGFAVSGLGLNSATVGMSGAALIVPQNAFDFSYFISSPSQADITITSAQLVDGVRNYIEATLTTLDGTPLTKAFWDPEANNGQGAEFNQIVDTITDLQMNFLVSTGGFSGNPNNVPVAIIDTNGSGVIKLILDRRQIYGRLAIPSNINNVYPWGTKQEPIYSLTLSGESGTFVSGETISIGSETATVVTGGTSAITFNRPSGINFFNGSSVTGMTSGATGSVNTVLEAFAGVDKSLGGQKNINDALMTEIRAIKGTLEWYGNVSYSSNIRGSSSDSMGARLGVLTDAMGDEQEDRSGYLRSDNVVTWTGTQVQWSASIVLELLNTKSGTLTQHNVLVGSSPVTVNNGESVYVSINRLSSSETVTPVRSSITPIPAQTQATKDVFVLFRRVDVGGIEYLHVPFMKSLMAPGQSIRLGQSGSGSGIGKVTFYDPVNTTLPTGSSLTEDGVSVANGDTVLFSNLSSGNNEIYQISGVGTSITWTPVAAFNGFQTPSSGDLVVVTKGNAFANQVGEFNGTTWLFNATVRHFNGTDFWEQSALITSTLADNTTGNIFSVTATGNENSIVDFSLSRGGIKETGSLKLTHDGTNAFIESNSSFSGDPGVTFFADISGGNLRLRFTTTSTGAAATMKYSVKRWSDSAGGPTGLPNYSPFTGVPVESAFCMSDSSGTPIDCNNPTNVMGKTQVQLTGFTYSVGVRPGTTVGDLEVYVNGQRMPRFVTGSTLDGYYKEIDSATIEFYTDITTSPLSIEIVKRS